MSWETVFSIAAIDLGYENISDNESLYIPIVPTLSEESTIPMIADKDAVDYILKNPLQCDRSHGCAHVAAACT